jgi:peptidyl-prolyl cis-trans isomerase B (cyclophilin B)
VPTPWLDGKHTVFGEVIDAKDQAVVDKIARGDTIKRIVIEGDTSSLYAEHADQLAKWNATLDSR